MPDLKELVQPQFTTKTEDSTLASEKLLKGLKKCLDAHSHVPLYRQVSSQIEQWIEEGRLKQGEQLASERRMTELLKVSRRTIRAALSDLIGRHYVSASHGRGNFVLAAPSQRELRFLGLEQFSPERLGIAPCHYDLISEAEAKSNSLVHYKYAPSLEKLREILQNPPRGYDGILVHRPAQEWIHELLKLEKYLEKELPIPLLVAGRDLRGSSLNFVSQHHFDHSYEATRKLIEMGHKRIGYISGQMSVDYIKIAFDGYSQAMREAGLHIFEEDQFYFETMDATVIEEALVPFLASRKFAAVVVAGSVFSVPFENAVQRSPIVVPDQLSVILITEQYVLDGLTIRWTAHLHPNQAMALRSLEALCELSRGQIHAPVQELLPHIVIEGATCRPA